MRSKTQLRPGSTSGHGNAFRIIVYLASAGLILFGWHSCAKSSSELREIHFFFMEGCAGCEGFRRAQNLSGRLNVLIRDSDTISGGSFNILDDPENYELLLEVLGREPSMEVPGAAPMIQMPVLIIGRKTLYHQYDAIEEALDKIIIGNEN